MRALGFWIAVSVALAGATTVVAGIAVGLWVWFTDVAAWHWQHGNPWPMIIPIAVVMTIGGCGIAAALEKKN